MVARRPANSTHLSCEGPDRQSAVLILVDIVADEYYQFGTEAERGIESQEPLCSTSAYTYALITVVTGVFVVFSRASIPST